jgi:hypothetical protein
MDARTQRPEPHPLTADQRGKARAGAWRFSRRQTPDAELQVELDERCDALARYQADIEAGIFADGDAERLQGGIDYERHHIESIVTELEARERARAYGYRTPNAPAESDLDARFAAARAMDTAAVIRDLSGQEGTRVASTSTFTCPFHGDGRERTPSLTAYPGERGWYCFSCGLGGDAVHFVMEMHGIGAVEALRLLESGVLGVRVPA